MLFLSIPINNHHQSSIWVYIRTAMKSNLKENSLNSSSSSQFFVIFLMKSVKTCWFQPLKRKDLLLFLVIYDRKWTVKLQTRHNHVKVSFWDLAVFKKGGHGLRSMINIAEILQSVELELVFVFQARNVHKAKRSLMLHEYLPVYITKVLYHFKRFIVPWSTGTLTLVKTREQKHVKDTKNKIKIWMLNIIWYE